MKYTLDMSTSGHQAVSLMKVAKPLDVIVGQLTTKIMNKIMVQHTLQKQLVEQCKLFMEVIVQQSTLLQHKLLAAVMLQQTILLMTLSKGGGGTSIHQTVRPIMAAKPLNVIIGKPIPT